MPAAMTPDEAGKLIVTGLTFGCIHVLAGADHLSALATLAVGSKWKAFSLGIRWGLGHSTGLIIVAAIILGLGDRIDPKVLEHACSWIVGVFMILLGVWGIFKARKHEVVRQAAAAAAAAEGVEGGKERGDDALQQQEEGRGGRGGDELAAAAAVGSPVRTVNDPKSSAAAAAAAAAAATVTSTPSSTSSSMADEEEGMETELIPPFEFNSTGGGGVRSEGGDCKENKEEEEEEEERIRKSSNSSSTNNNTARQKARSSSSSSSTTTTSTTTNPPSLPPSHHHEISADAGEPFLDEECEELDHWLLIRARQCLHLDIESPTVQRVVAFSVGIIHGIAGPGGILGVLPAARLHSWPKASLYLATFCLTSTLIMGVFAAVYGECTSRIGSAAKIEYRLELFSASLSIIVGVLWMALIIAGKLDVVFG